MKNPNTPEQFCEVCDSPLIYVDHYEYDGVTEHGSHEPYFECPNGCDYPTEPRVDTCTEFGLVIPEQERGAFLL